MRKILIILIGCSWQIVSSQTAVFYFTSFGGDMDDVGNCVIQSRDSGFTIVGSTGSFGALQSDMFIMRTDKKMQFKWQKIFGGIAGDVAKSVVELDDSSFVIAGYSASFGSGGYDAVIYKIDKAGNVLWQKTYGGNDWDFAYSIKKTSDNNLIICGETYSFGNGVNDAFILKMDYSGNTIWSKTYGGDKEDVFKDIIQVSDGSYLAVGTTKSFGDTLGDIWIAKVDIGGDSIAFKTFGGNKREVGNSVVETKSNDFLIAGGSESFTSGKEDAYVLKLSNSFATIWDRYFGQAADDEEAYSIKNSTSGYGDMLICFTTKEVSVYKKDSKALLLSSLGYYIDGGRSGSYENEEFFSIDNTIDKGYVLTGYTESFGAKLKDVYLLKYDSLVTGTGQYFVGLDKHEVDFNLNIGVYPNPFTDLIQITIPVADRINMIEITDLEGRIVVQKQGDKLNKETFTNLYLVPGYYTLRVLCDLNIYTKKIFCATAR